MSDTVRLYSVAQVADLLGVSRPWVYERINRREFPVVELGDTRAKQRISSDFLNKYIESRTHGPKGSP